jgi:ubiquinone biosynthesis protein COQ4
MPRNAVTANYVVPPLPRRLAKAGRALFALARNPNELDRVFEIGEALNAPRVPAMLDGIAATPDGRRILEVRPTIDTKSVDLGALRALPDGTLGREYTRFLDDNRITPDVFKSPEIGDPRVAYVMQRIRQTHDLWHVLTGYGPDVIGEILLQAFTYAQLRVPSALALTLVGWARFGRKQPRFAAHMRDAYRRGRATAPLAMFMWEDHWAEQVVGLRERLACPPRAA